MGLENLEANNRIGKKYCEGISAEQLVQMYKNRSMKDSYQQNLGLLNSLTMKDFPDEGCDPLIDGITLGDDYKHQLLYNTMSIANSFF